eukprot:2571863-Karenia_brevis.AAC.1
MFADSVALFQSTSSQLHQQQQPQPAPPPSSVLEARIVSLEGTLQTVLSRLSNLDSNLGALLATPQTEMQNRPKLEELVDFNTLQRIKAVQKATPLE